MLSSDDHVPMLIFAYAPWCPHCKVLFKIWDELSEKYKDDNTFSVAQLNCTDGENQKICSRIGVRGFPSFFTFVDNNLKSIEVSRNLKGFENAIKKIKKSSDREILKDKLSKAKFPFFIFTIGNGNYAALEIAKASLQSLGVSKDNVYFRMKDVGINCNLYAYSDVNVYEKMNGNFESTNIKKFISKYMTKMEERNENIQINDVLDHGMGFKVAIIFLIFILVSFIVYIVYKLFPRNVPKGE